MRNLIKKRKHVFSTCYISAVVPAVGVGVLKLIRYGCIERYNNSYVDYISNLLTATPESAPLGKTKDITIRTLQTTIMSHCL